MSIEVIMDACASAIGYCKRHMLIDYKDRNGNDRNTDVFVWHGAKMTDAAIVKAIKRQLGEEGYTLSALSELDTGRAIYLAPGFIEECIADLGLTVSGDIAANLKAAGFNPINLDELMEGWRK